MSRMIDRANKQKLFSLVGELLGMAGVVLILGVSLAPGVLG